MNLHHRLLSGILLKIKLYNIPFELHIYPKGGHGLSLCDQRTAKPDADYLVNTHVGTWFRLAIEWMKQL